MVRTGSCLHSQFMRRLHEIVGDAGFVSDEQCKRGLDTDWLKRWHGRSCAAVRPETTQEVAQVMGLCHNMRIPVVTQGGNTGMCGGAAPDDSGAQLLLSTTRLRAVRDVDPVNNTLTTEAGVSLAEVQRAALQVNRYFPLSLGSEDGCTIGGNLATNAGGGANGRYDSVRDLALGLEVVLPDGRVWNGLRALRKDNAGYALRELFIGSEGTLGVVTAAVLKLVSRPSVRVAAWVGCASMEKAVALLSMVRDACGDRLAAFDMLTEESLRLVVNRVSDARRPLAMAHDFHVLIDLADTHDAGLASMLQTVLRQAMSKGLIDDATLGIDPARRAEFWRIRQGISQAQALSGRVIRHDVSLPVSTWPRFVADARAEVKRIRPDAGIVIFGHMGDGSLHFNVLMPLQTCYVELASVEQQMTSVIHDLVHRVNGSVGAEHGVGQLRREALRHYKSPVECDLMMLLKQAIDPNQIMNPGKVL